MNPTRETFSASAPIPDRPLPELAHWLLTHDWDPDELHERLRADYKKAAGEITETSERWWVLHDTAIVTTLNRVEAGEITAEEAHAILLENTTQEDTA